MKRNDITKSLERFLKQSGIRTYRYEMGGKHPRLVIQHRGRELVIGFAGSSRNRNAPYDTVRRLRHALGFIGRAA
jgi:hypothetical protein